MSDEQRESRVKGLFDDLLNLEVNIIVKPGMTARKMPDAWNALIDIAEFYDELLGDFADHVGREWVKQQRKPPIPVLAEEDAAIRGAGRPERIDETGHLKKVFTGSVLAGSRQAVGFDTFDRLRQWALEMAAAARVLVEVPAWPRHEELDGKCVLFKRIYRNCDQLKDILDGLPHVSDGKTRLEKDIQLTSEQLVTLRKIWEVGVETVVMQTVIQLDGDIITRMQEGRTASNKAIQDLHQESVGNAIRHWQFLGQTLAQFLGSVLNKFL